MKLPPARIDAFLRAPDAATTLALLYGPDAGLMAERSKKLLTAVTDPDDPFSTVELPYEKIKADPALLADEMAAISFSRKRRFIKVKGAAASLDKPIQEILSAHKSDTFVLFCAEDLPPASSLRKFFETTPHAASLPCYTDDATSIRTLITSTLQPLFQCEPGVVEYLQQCFSGDRLVIRNELEKLCLFVQGSSHLALADVQKVVRPSGEISFNDINHAVASCDARKIEASVRQALLDGVSPIAILRALGNYFLKLHYLKGQVTSGMTEDAAIEGLRPPVFFKDKPLLKRHVNQWPLTGIAKVLSLLERTERDCKQTGSPAELLTKQLVAALPFYCNAR